MIMASQYVDPRMQGRYMDRMPATSPFHDTPVQRQLACGLGIQLQDLVSSHGRTIFQQQYQPDREQLAIALRHNLVLKR